MQIPNTPDQRTVLYSFAAYLLLLFILYFNAFSGMFKIWTSSETYAHGLIIVPIAVFLLWSKRSVIFQRQFIPDVRISLLILLLSLLWFFSRLLSVNFTGQIAVMLLIPAGVFAFLGRDIFVKLSFPLFYLLFAVPMGESLVPLLQDYTASFTVNALNLFGFSVFVDGRYFETAGGKFEISAACSGVRYLIASIAVGSLYAYLQFRTLKNRVYIVLLSIVLPIVANGMRAFIIVLLVYYTSGRWGIGADHLYYGWLFFAIVMLLLFAIGHFFKEKTVAHVEFFSAAKNTAPGHWVMALGLTTLAFLSGPVLFGILKQETYPWHARPLVNVIAGSGWKVSAPEFWDWFPEFDNAILEVKAQLQKNNARVKFESVYTSILSEKGDLDVDHQLLHTEFWKVTSRKPLTIELNTPINSSAKIDGVELKLKSGDKQRLVFYYYNVSGTLLRSRLQVKLHELAQALSGSYRYTSLHWIQVVDLPENKTPNEVLVDVMENFDPASLVGFESEGS